MWIRIALAGALGLAASCADPVDSMVTDDDPRWRPVDGLPTGCVIEAAGRPATLAPLRWVACDRTLGGATDCQQLAVDHGVLGAELEVVLGSVRVTVRDDDHRLRLVIDDDGTIRAALREPLEGCTAGVGSLAHDHVAWRVFVAGDDGAPRETGGLAIGGAIGEPPRVLAQFAGDQTASIVAGPRELAIVTTSGVSLQRWDGGGAHPLALDVPAGTRVSHLRFLGDDLVLAVSSLARNEEWQIERDGPRRLLGSGDDWSRGAADLGGDDSDRVWVEGQDRPDADAPFASLLVRTAPVRSADLAAGARDLLRLGPHPFGTMPFVVGDGWAARLSTVAEGNGLREGIAVVRIGDGAAWLLPGGAAAPWRAPLAISDGALWASAATPSGPTVVRIAIDQVPARGRPIAP